jgi:hypothetical protein
METLTKLTVVYPIPACPCSKNGTTTAAGTGGMTRSPGATSVPVVVAGGMKDAPPGVVTALTLGGVALIFFVFL